MEDKIYDLIKQMQTDINKRFDEIDQKFIEKINDTYGLLETLYVKFDKRFARTDERFDKVEEELGEVRQEINRIGTKIDGEITDKIKALFDDRQVVHGEARRIG